ncbi:prefoldin subunit beta [Candidatus Woesearchaeota archaeon]|nr:prefoldin subunit beta [Candidatus Woesearchaeota archaeon]
MEVNKDTENKIAQLQMLEQNIQNFLMQKQNFQTQLIEVDNAIEEIEKAKGKTYKIIGSIMVASDKENINKDLHGKKEILELRIKNIEKQENQLKEKAANLQSDVLKQMKKKED